MKLTIWHEPDWQHNSSHTETLRGMDKITIYSDGRVETEGDPDSCEDWSTVLKNEKQVFKLEVILP